MNGEQKVKQHEIENDNLANWTDLLNFITALRRRTARFHSFILYDSRDSFCLILKLNRWQTNGIYRSNRTTTHRRLCEFFDLHETQTSERVKSDKKNDETRAKI